MRHDAFSKYHPLTNFLFFLGAIGFSMVIQHPAYLALSFAAGCCYCFALEGRKTGRLLLGLIPLFLLVAAVNPLFNTRGETVLTVVFGRNYTLEALVYGMVVAGMLVNMLVWFRCYSAVLTSDKFICLFGRILPSLSLLLVMVLRLIPNLGRKARQISGARRSIGKGLGAQSTRREKAADGIQILSALTGWALEGGIVAGDSMRSRGYGTARRTSFQLYRFTPGDMALIALMGALAAGVLACGGTQADFTPVISIHPVTWGLAFFGIFLFLPSALHLQEAIRWHISISRI